jgi:transcriptional regulator with PAS, ATPase and Fis domain
MTKTLFSWIAKANDFTGNKVDKENSPNYLFHKHFYNYDRHIILYASDTDELRATTLLTTLKQDFPEHEIKKVNMEVSNVIHLTEVKTKVEALLLQYRDDKIDIFFSPGTSVMQVSWYICHTSLGLKSRLVQLVPSKYTRSGKPELMVMETGKSDVPMSATIREFMADEKDKGKTTDYLITPSIREIYDKADKIAQTDRVTVLIYGESGTGKEHLAGYIHEQSVRKEQPFITVNCSAFQDSLLESRLFGYKKGAFTGATSDTKGLFELASHGTIFLDEIGDISPYMQQSLLRVVQEHEIQPVGGKSKKVDVRIIAATNKDLHQLCVEGKFRWDLYYRLAVVELTLPPLIQRGASDLNQMLDYFILKKKKELRKSKKLQLSAKLREFILSYPFPGNVRELENLVETLYVFHEDRPLTPDDLPARFRYVPDEFSLNWRDVEKQHIIKVLKLKKGNKRQANIALGYGSINTLNKKIEEYNIII